LSTGLEGALRTRLQFQALIAQTCARLTGGAARLHTGAAADFGNKSHDLFLMSLIKGLLLCNLAVWLPGPSWRL
jgi:hypothetical protein